MSSDTPIWQLTIGEFESLVRNLLNEIKKQEPDNVVGNVELAKKLGVSSNTITNYKKRGLLEGCYMQIGNKIIYDYGKIKKIIKK